MEAPERGAERLWVKLAEQAAERVVARRPVGEREDAAKKPLLGLREQRHVHRTLPAAQHRAQRDEQKLVEVVQARVAGPRVVQLVPAGRKLVQDTTPHARRAPNEAEAISTAPSKPPPKATTFQVRLPWARYSELLTAHDGISNLFHLRRYHVPAAQYRAARTEAFQVGPRSLPSPLRRNHGHAVLIARHRDLNPTS